MTENKFLRVAVVHSRTDMTDLRAWAHSAGIKAEDLKAEFSKRRQEFQAWVDSPSPGKEEAYAWALAHD